MSDLARAAGLGVTRREPGSGIPVERWVVTEYASVYAEYPGHAFVTTDPAGPYRSVCEGFIDDMQHIVALHNAWVDAVSTAEGGR